MSAPTFDIGDRVRTPHTEGTVTAWRAAGVCANWCSHHAWVETAQAVHTKWYCPRTLALANDSARVSELAPGDAFSAIPTGTQWTLERHDGEISWAVRHAPGDARHGERDRFAPHVLVQRGHS